ncbi:UNVERIFIED_CONTAM: Adenylate kinase 8 [Gekko kuhli]
MEGIPDTRELARALQEKGILPRHVVVLHAADTVLIERNLGKRVDIFTGEVYHTTFDWPSDEAIQKRLKAPEGISEVETTRRLLEYHRNFPGILQSFEKPMKLINADQPCADVFSQVLSHVQAPPRTPAPFSPRILLCGPPGCGKSLQAALLSQKYGIINVCCGQLLKEAVANETKLGELIKPSLDDGWPVRVLTYFGVLQSVRVSVPDASLYREMQCDEIWDPCQGQLDHARSKRSAASP